MNGRDQEEKKEKEVKLDSKTKLVRKIFKNLQDELASLRELRKTLDLENFWKQHFEPLYRQAFKNKDRSEEANNEFEQLEEIKVKFEKMKKKISDLEEKVTYEIGWAGSIRTSYIQLQPNTKEQMKDNSEASSITAKTYKDFASTENKLKIAITKPHNVVRKPEMFFGTEMTKMIVNDYRKYYDDYIKETGELMQELDQAKKELNEFSETFKNEAKYLYEIMKLSFEELLVNPTATNTSTTASTSTAPSIFSTTEDTLDYQKLGYPEDGKEEKEEKEEKKEAKEEKSDVKKPKKRVVRTRLTSQIFDEGEERFDMKKISKPKQHSISIMQVFNEENYHEEKQNQNIEADQNETKQPRKKK